MRTETSTGMAAGPHVLKVRTDETGRPVMLNVIGMITAAILATACDPVETPGPDPTWLTDHAEAVELSRRTGKPILADFTGSDWCHWCIKLEEEVFDQPGFERWAEKNVILLKLDFPRGAQSEALRRQNAALQQRYRVQGYPTVLFLDADGNVLGRTGYRRGGAKAWTTYATGILSLHRQAPAEPEPPAAPPAATWLTSWDRAIAESRRTKRPILADFTGSDWCGWCIKLKREVFDTDAFKSWAKDNVVLLEVDFPRRERQPDELRRQNQGLARRYGVRGYPTILFLDADAKKLGEMGYERGGPEPWIKKAGRIVQ